MCMPSLKLEDERLRRLQQLLQEYREVLSVSAETLCTLRDEMVSQMNAALSGKGPSSMLMLPHVVDQLPNGYESGDFFALDMGGTNFRTVCAKLSGKPGEMADLEMEKFPIEDWLRSVPATELFDFMAAKLVALAERIGKRPTPGTEAIVGFCFSFPMHQTSPHHGTLIQWSKGFTNAGAEGQDPAVMLEEALQRQGMPGRVTALVNDAVASFAACRYTDSSTMLGVILGTGVNGAYVEQAQRVQNAGRPLPEDAHVIINCEWAEFVADALPHMHADSELDADTVNPGHQHFEKMTAGLYLGDIARRIILRLAEEATLFGQHVPDQLKVKGALHTSQMSEIDHDTSTDLQATACMLQECLQLPQHEVTLEACQAVQQVCHAVGTRAGRLKSIAIAAVMQQLGQDTGQKAVVGVDGGVFEQYGNYREAILQGLAEILGTAAAACVEFTHVADASSLGAAYLAAAAVRTNSANDSHSELRV